MTEIKKQAQTQFSTHAHSYVTSEVHAQGGSLQRLQELIPQRPYKRLLDIATGGGHTAYALSHLAELTIASDLTHPMLQAARRSGIQHCQHDAEALPYPAASFDLITCRIAPHHFPYVQQFVHEVARTLHSEGIFALVDNVVSGMPKVGAWLNAFEKLRDPSHHMCYSIDDWSTFCFTEDLRVTHSEILWKTLDFDAWVQRAGVSPADRTRLRLMLQQPPKAIAEWLQPQYRDGRILFRIAECIIIAELN